MGNDNHGAGEGCMAKVVTVHELLATKNLRIPDYQRSYEWTGRNVRQLIDDIREFSQYPSYRIGSVILHDNRGDGKEGDDIAYADIVDGQQRIITFVILIKALLSRRNGRDGFWTEQARELGGGLEIRGKASRERVFANYREALNALRFLDGDDAIDGFLGYLLNKCEVLLVTVEELGEAFQMFDSQNARGKALEPTDLLKAFHIRVMERSGVPREREYDSVNRWESIPEGDIPRLFRDHLYRIRRWSVGRKASDADYAANAVDMFRGIDPDADQSQNNWARVYLLALDRVNEYADANRALTRSGIVDGLDYPFQIDQPVINGEQFFLMTEHYHRLARWLGIFPAGDEDGDASDGLERHVDTLAAKILETFRRCGEGRDWWRYCHIRNLFDCLMLYYVDRFGMRDLDEAVHVFFVYAATPRLQLRSYRFVSTNKYVVNGEISGLRNIPNAFACIHDSARAVDAVDVHVSPVELAGDDGKRCDTLRDLYDIYKKAIGRAQDEENVDSGDAAVGKPFEGVNSLGELMKRVRELVREGFDDTDVIQHVLLRARIISHECNKKTWGHVAWFPYDRQRSIRQWIDDIKDEEQGEEGHHE